MIRKTARQWIYIGVALGKRTILEITQEERVNIMIAEDISRNMEPVKQQKC